jgi:photosystem II stability/assembly factor-like uncharacterized protein
MITSTTKPLRSVRVAPRTRRARSVRYGLAALLAAAVTFALAPSAPGTSLSRTHMPSWHMLSSPSGATYRTLAAVSRQIAWIGSDDGTVLRTADGGQSWTDVSPPGTANLHFRDLYAGDAYRAVAMTAGSGSDSRLYATSDGGRNWRLAYQASDPATFFDAMAFFDSQRGLVISDPVAGKFQILSTTDGGDTWAILPNAGMPAAQPDEYGFADSGTTLVTAGRDAWFGSGGSVSRVYHSRDGGLTWDVETTPILSGSVEGTAGVYGLAFRTANLGLAVGGDFLTPDVTSHVSAVSYLGHPWVSPAKEPSGVRFAAAWLPFTLATAVAVGINGSDVSYDAGQHWARFDDGEFNTVGCAADGTCWAAGDAGRVAILRR